MTLKQRLFVAYYLGESNGNATDAARRAGYATPDPMGSQLLGNSRIKALVEAKIREISMPQEEVLMRITDIARGSIFDVGNAYGLDYKPNMTKAKKGGKGHIIKKYKKGRDGAVDIELHDSLAALDKLAKYHRLYDEDGAKSFTVADLMRAAEVLENASKADAVSDDSENQPDAT